MLKNLDSVSFYRVHPCVKFEDDWFDYLIQSNLPSFYRVIPIIFDCKCSISLDSVIRMLSDTFSLVLVDKYLSRDRVALRIVTNKSLSDIIFNLDRLNGLFSRPFLCY